MATKKECFEMGIQAAYNAQAAGYEIITMVKEDGIFDGDYEYAVKVLGDDWDTPKENREAFVSGWNSVAIEMICDKCGAVGGLHYQGPNEHGANGICNKCMLNKMINQIGELIDAKEAKTTADNDTDDMERCDVCGWRSPQLHYYGSSSEGDNGICNSCMTNMQVKDGVFQPIN